MTLGADAGGEATRTLGTTANAMQMEQLIRGFDWSATPLGPSVRWSVALRTALDLCLRSRMCSSIYWGPQRLLLYNDAYSTILGDRHPWALGRPAHEVWSEIFDVIGPLMTRTFETRETTGTDDAAIFLNRAGYVEEYYCSFSYAPLINEHGATEGVFTMFPETTARVVGQRRLGTLQRIGAETREVRHPAEVLEIVARILAENGRDIPFAAFYLWNEDGTWARYCAGANIEPGTALSPRRIAPQRLDPLGAALREAHADRPVPVPLDVRTVDVPLGRWPVRAEMLLVQPFEAYSERAPRAFMLAGMNPYKRLDDDYLDFLRLFADQVSRALAEAHGHEQDDTRLREIEERSRVEQQQERVRIARDLHDTVLQSLQGMRFLLEAGIERLHGSEADAIELFDQALGASVRAIDEGREVLTLLRASSPSMSILTTAFEALGEELVTPRGATLSVTTKGRERRLSAAVWDDVYGICREVIVNAMNHAAPTTLDIAVEFGDPLRIRLTDDGCGISAEHARSGRSGHYGIPGMRERTQRIGGVLDIAAAPPAGTRVDLEVPANEAYATPPESAQVGAGTALR